MTKSEFVDQVAERSGLSRSQASHAVDAVLDTIKDALKRGSEVALPGFGKFSASPRSAREGRNPATGEKIQISASRTPKFTASSALKAAVRSGDSAASSGRDFLYGCSDEPYGGPDTDY
jgi:DNA-binding protein HU-beta